MTAAARLFSRTGETRALEHEFDGETIIGREPGSGLRIDRPLMSGRHARIFYDRDEGRFMLEDLGSLNGTCLDGDPVTAPERLGHLHVITFAGRYDFFFQDRERCAQRHPDAISAAAKEPATVAAAPAAGSPAAGSPAAGERLAAAPLMPSDVPSEVTSIERDPVALPGLLARRADEAGKRGGDKAADDPREVTAVEKEPFGLPAALARRADEETAGEPRSPAEQTMRERLPVALPGVLARKADQVQRQDTVDLAEIEHLIAEDQSAPEAHRGDEARDLAAGLQLVVTGDSGEVKRFRLVPGENLVGRSADVEVLLAYNDLSRSHAVITVAFGTITLRDLGSRNRTFVDDRALEAHVDVAIQPGAVLRFGSVEARLVQLGGST